MKERKKSKRRKRKTCDIVSSQAHKVAREHMSSSQPAHPIHQLTAPPPILWRLCHRNDIPLLEIKLFVGRRSVVVQRLDCTPRSVTTPMDNATQHTHRKTRSADRHPYGFLSVEAAVHGAAQATATASFQDSPMGTTPSYLYTSAAARLPHDPRSDSADDIQDASPVHNCCNSTA